MSKFMSINKRIRWCPNCQIGKQTARTITFTTRVDGRLLQVPDVNLYSCDICGYEEFDAEVGEMIDELNALDTLDSQDTATTSGDQAALNASTRYERKDLRPK